MHSVIKGEHNSCSREKEGVTFSQVVFSEEVMLKIISFTNRRREALCIIKGKYVRRRNEKQCYILLK